MVHAGCGQPCIGFVAGAASCLGRNVARWLACRDAPVVTTGAAVLRNPDVVEVGARERIRVMATVAGLLRWKVVDRFGDIAPGQSVTAYVATCTVAWSPLENAIHMAGLTAHTTVLAQERKAGFDVVKLVITGLGNCAGHATDPQQKHHQKLSQSRGDAGRCASCHAMSPVACTIPTLGLKPFQVSTPWH